jgi:hypothetical protein
MGLPHVMICMSQRIREVHRGIHGSVKFEVYMESVKYTYYAYKLEFPPNLDSCVGDGLIAGGDLCFDSLSHHIVLSRKL